MTKLHESKMDSTLLFNPFPVVYMNFARKNLLACLCSAEFTVETISMIFLYLVNFYPQIRDPINLIYMSTTYLESFGADLSENELFKCAPLLFVTTSTIPMTRNGDIRSMSGTEGIWGAGVKWEARDASAHLEPLGMFFYYCIFLTILTSLLKVLCLQMMTSRVTGREGRWE